MQIALIAAVIGSAAFAQDIGTSMPEAGMPRAPEATVAIGGDAEKDPDIIVCRKANPPTGTRIQGRGRQQMCMTKADWALLEAETQQAARDLLGDEFDMPSENPPPNPK